jgi:hypothetical protein
MKTPRDKYLKSMLDQLASLRQSLHGKDFLLTWEKSTDDLKAVMLAAEILQAITGMAKAHVVSATAWLSPSSVTTAPARVSALPRLPVCWVSPFPNWMK